MSQTVLYFERLKPADMTAKKLVLSLLSVAEHEQQAVTNLIAAGTLFDIEPAAMRMALTRLVKDGFLTTVDRGVYAMGPEGQSLHAQVSAWTTVQDRTRPWTGDWIVVQVDHLGRTNKTRLRARERALRLLGLSQSDSGLWVRPNNLNASLNDARDTLVNLGLDEGALIVVASEVALPRGETWTDLWSVKELEKAYTAAADAMAQSSGSIGTLAKSEAAKETLLIGQSVIRLITFDPLLPSEMINRLDFDRVVNHMREYNELGIQCWKAYYGATI